MDAIEQHFAEDDPAFVTKLTKPSWRVRLSGPALCVVGRLASNLASLALLVPHQAGPSG
ncbi:hypothetical protein ACFOWZ_36900 [Lentzea rhizosphaerae]|uniref:Uncharacterized protein n=1 Tax=Lentzea rhizosphaerae TaxID=2041025 RepID=A0ABV8C4Z1_9PSEU